MDDSEERGEAFFHLDSPKSGILDEFFAHHSNSPKHDILQEVFARHLDSPEHYILDPNQNNKNNKTSKQINKQTNK